MLKKSMRPKVSFAMSDTYMAGKKNWVKNRQIFLKIFLDYNYFFYVFMGRETQKKQKNIFLKIFFTYFSCFNSDYCTILTLLTIRCRIYKICFEINSQF